MLIYDSSTYHNALELVAAEDVTNNRDASVPVYTPRWKNECEKSVKRVWKECENEVWKRSVNEWSEQNDGHNGMDATGKEQELSET